MSTGPIHYAGGEESRPGDRVEFEGETAVVEEVIATPAQIASWDLDGRGVMLAGSSHGRLFQPEDDPAWSALVLLARAPATAGDPEGAEPAAGTAPAALSAVVGPLRRAAAVVESAYAWLDSPRRHRALERTFVGLAAAGFVAHLAAIFVSRNSPVFAEQWLGIVDRNYLHAIYTPFSFVLFYEVLQLVLALPKSHTAAIEKQYEIVSLIVVRRVFKDLGGFESLEHWPEQIDAAKSVVLDMFGAAVMFLLVMVFGRLRSRITRAPLNRNTRPFVAAKKLVSVFLLALLGVLAVQNLGVWALSSAAMNEVERLGVRGLEVEPLELDRYFFPAFFEVMIFTDVFLLILSIAFYDRYELVFRNAGFVISTVLLRVSLTSPTPYDLGVAVFAMLYGLVVLMVYLCFVKGPSGRA